MITQHSLYRSTRRLLAAAALALPFWLWSAGAQAGLTLDLQVQRYQDGYLFYASLRTNAVAPDAPYGDYHIASPQWPTGGSLRLFQVGPNGAQDRGGSMYVQSNEAALMNAITNGDWTITVTNATATNTYTFEVTNNGFTVASLPNFSITYPLEGAVNIPARPTFTWQSLGSNPGNAQVGVYQRDANWNWTFQEFGSVPAGSGNWTIPRDIPAGQTYFNLQYWASHPAPLFLSSTPLHVTTAQPLSGWESASGGRFSREVGFTVAGTGPGGGHQLVAHYAFDDSDNLGLDSSGNDHQINGSSSWGLPIHEASTDAMAGSGAVLFYGNSSLAPPTNVLASLYGSFTVSAWLKTTQSFGADDALGPQGSGVVQAFKSYSTYCTIPIALTGAKAAFFTASEDSPYQDTLHSVSDVNTGEYVHIAVTRQQSTGEKKLYVNGVLEATSLSTTHLLDAATDMFDLGLGGYPGYDGLLDDVQFYSGVLSADQIATLYNSPGSTIPDETGGSPLGNALNAPELTWTTGGESEWFVQTAETHDGASAAQSGAIDDDGQSYLETTVSGPGTLSFWWKVSCEEGSDYLEFYLDGDWMDGITGEDGWWQFTTEVGPGTHTLRWVYTKDFCCTEGADAAWLDQVQFGAPVEVNVELEIIREVDSTYGEHYLLFPFINSIAPTPLTYHSVQSPTGLFEGQDGGEYSASSTWISSLGALLAECTNGNWRLMLDVGSPSEREYTFQVSISDLTTNILSAVTILSPTNGSVNVPTNPPFQWSGPSSFNSLYAYVYPVAGGSGIGSNLPSSATTWPSAPAVAPGTNRFYVSYTSNNFPSVSFTTPVDASFQPVASWTAGARLRSSATSQFVVGGSVGSLLNPRLGGGGLQFDLLTQSGQPYAIEARTNLTSGTWSLLTNFTGNGALMQFTLPTTNPPTRFFRARTN